VTSNHKQRSQTAASTSYRSPASDPHGGVHAMGGASMLTCAALLDFACLRARWVLLLTHIQSRSA
jgi:hypothetical protein